MLYTAKGTAALLVPIASIVSASYGWQAVFVIAVALNATAALMAIFVIKPLRRSFILGHELAGAEQEAKARDVKTA
jgi:OFA family oxalate/formate antiporter-like MFS transporter